MPTLVGRRVVGAPQVVSSNGVTRIFFEGSTIYERPAPPKREKGTRDHASSFGVVYANETARASLANNRPAKFPVGSILVREKLARPDDALPELVAVMLKRAPGFNPKGGDWEFLTLDGALKQVRERQKTGSCLGCHAAQREKDFVFPPPPAEK
ncbi:MAG TPA: cytochrome P460 family protein [Pyrinomonadaceae bacterium]|nr:cytochrome P460 family protein [Pyrinomonadaceae bacterium]